MYTEKMNINLAEIEKFPVTPYLTEICDSLKKENSRAIVLTAETGAGKSTILPLGLLQNFSGKIVMTEPRRLAVLGVSSRVSELLNEECGNTAGYKIHLESKISKNTRLEVLTEAVLVRMLQENPELDGYEVVVLDEAHERSVNFDLALAFLKEAMELRDDLYVVVMSATINARKIGDFLGTEKIFTIPGRTFPVEVEYDSKSTVEQAILKQLAINKKGNLLVFLPGISDINKARERLVEQIGNDSDYEICILHSSISLESQKKILKPANDERQRIILSSAIAETSLTVPDVTVVIDSGYSRVARIEISTGIQKLVTERESLFSAEQRKGRAGRVQEGKCIRLWSEHDVRINELAPEILRCELSELVLECADRGISSPDKIKWLDKPNFAEWKESSFLLEQLGFLNSEGKITPEGRMSLRLGLSPRLAEIVLEDGLHSYNSGNKVTELSKEAVQLLISYGNYKKSTAGIQNQFINDIQYRLQKLDFSNLNKKKFSKTKDYKAELVLAGFPDRLARRVTSIESEKAEYQFPNGRKAVLSDSAGKKPEWIVAPEVVSGSKDSVIYEYEVISESYISEWLKDRLETVNECSFVAGKVRKQQNLCFGRLIISSKNLPADSSDYGRAWVSEVQKCGLKCLPKNKKIELFLQRAAFALQQKCLEKDFYENGTEKNALEQLLVEKVEDWLLPFVTSNNLSEQNVYDGLYWFLNGSKIDSEIPEILVMPNGNKAKVKYEWLASPEDKNKMVLRPVIEIIIQRVFGCFETPEICGMKVLLRLLSPASRPLQITDDLKNFWNSTWPEICKEMKGRYPKHNWDYSVVQRED